MKRSHATLPILVAAALLSGTASAASYPRTYVQSDGSDANTGIGCPVSNPCRTFQAAVDTADNGGEVIALDSEDFGIVKIEKSITIIGNNGRAGIVVPTASDAGVFILKSGVNVVLRGLDITGNGTGGNGVYLKDGGSLLIDNSALSNFVGNGVAITAPAKVRIVDSIMHGSSNGASIQAGATASIVRSKFVGNRGMGLSLVADTVGTTSATVSDSVASSNGLDGFASASVHKLGVGRMVVTGSAASHNRWGFETGAAEGQAFMTVGRSTASHNAIGFAQIPGVAGISTFETLGDNVVRQNGTATMGVITTVSPM